MQVVPCSTNLTTLFDQFSIDMWYWRSSRTETFCVLFVNDLCDPPAVTPWPTRGLRPSLWETAIDRVERSLSVWTLSGPGGKRKQTPVRFHAANARPFSFCHFCSSPSSYPVAGSSVWFFHLFHSSLPMLPPVFGSMATDVLPLCCKSSRPVAWKPNLLGTSLNTDYVTFRWTLQCVVYIYIMIGN